MMRVGIMQGRLVPPEPGRFQSFPVSRWRDEFELAHAAGLDAIEWIFDAFGAAHNPLGTETGLRELDSLALRHHVLVKSVCADWFMDFPLVHVPPAARAERWLKLQWLLGHCATLRIERVVLPFVDQSSMRDAAGRAQFVQDLTQRSDHIARSGIEIHLETDLAPSEFGDLLERLPFAWLKVNYDSGNSAALGYRPADEFHAYGNRIGSFHIKDRVKGGGTVPLGTGHTDFPSLVRELRKISYRGDLVLQVARDAPGNELEWSRRNVAFARDFAGKLESP